MGGGGSRGLGERIGFSTSCCCGMIWGLGFPRFGRGKGFRRRRDGISAGQHDLYTPRVERVVMGLALLDPVGPMFAGRSVQSGPFPSLTCPAFPLSSLYSLPPCLLFPYPATPPHRYTSPLATTGPGGICLRPAAAAAALPPRRGTASPARLSAAARGDQIAGEEGG